MVLGMEPGPSACKTRTIDKSLWPQKNIDLKSKTAVIDKECHYVTIKWSIQQKDITFVNIYAHHMGAMECLKQM